jgi:VIT1/CCC1 family predicted Fe2+/Mn2+ transporter
MAMGEWISVTTARESFQRQIYAEKIDLEQVPEEEKEELVLIYQAKGLPAEQAKALAESLIANKQTALDTLAREELGIDPDGLGGSAWTAASTSFGLFSLGAIFPVVPFAFLDSSTAILTSLAVSGAALIAIGAATSLFTGRSILSSGLRQLAFGYAAAAITFGIGRLIGVAIAG